MSKVVVIGTSTVGVGIAAGFLAHGTNTVVLGRSAEKALSCLDPIKSCANSISSDWPKLNPSLESSNIETWQEWNDVDFVIGTVSERLKLKQDIFASLDQRVPAHIPIGSNSSGFPISDIAKNLLQPIVYLMPTTSCLRISCHWLKLSLGNTLISVGKKTLPVLSRPQQETRTS